MEGFLTGGGRGDGDSNFTGSFGPVSSVKPCAAGMSGQPRETSRTTSLIGPRATTGLAITKSCPGPAPIPPGTAFQCQFTVQNLDPDNNVNTLAVTNQEGFPSGTPVVACIPCAQGGSP